MKLSVDNSSWGSIMRITPITQSPIHMVIAHDAEYQKKIVN